MLCRKRLGRDRDGRVGGEWASNAVIVITMGKETSSAEAEAGAWLVCSGNKEIL